MTAEDLPGGFTLPPGQPDGLSAMFAEYDRHGFHGGNPLALRTILRHEPRTVAGYHEPRTVAGYLAELGAAASVRSASVIHEEAPCPASPRPSRPTTCHAS